MAPTFRTRIYSRSDSSYLLNVGNKTTVIKGGRRVQSRRFVFMLTYLYIMIMDTGFTLNGQEGKDTLNTSKSSSSTRIGSEDDQLIGYGPESVIQTLLREPNVWRKLLATGGCWFIYDIAYCEFF